MCWNNNNYYYNNTFTVKWIYSTNIPVDISSLPNVKPLSFYFASFPENKQKFCKLQSEV